MSKPAIPAWQRTSATDPAAVSAAQPEPKPENAAEDSTSPVTEEPTMIETAEEHADSSELVAQAARFLEDANIRDAPREKKVVFLQAKGVSPEDIETLLGKTMDQGESPELEAAGERAWSTVSSGHACCVHRRPSQQG